MKKEKNTTKEWRERFKKKFGFPGGTMLGIGDKYKSAKGIGNHQFTYNRVESFISKELERKEKETASLERKRVAEEVVDEVFKIIEDSEWQCPEHGKEFRITPPLCEECNQCLEVNVVITNILPSLAKVKEKYLL